jgi:CelD/BcsL family acetyltransferase involved in cellulose biosynthesis
VFHRLEHVTELVQGTSEISRRTYQAGLGRGFVESRLWNEILTAEAESGRLRCYWLLAQGKPIGFQIGAIHGACYFVDFLGHLPEFSRLSPGIVLHTKVIDDLCSIGVKEYDYGFGDSEHKRVHGSGSRDEAVFEIHGKSLRGRTLCLVGRSTEALTRGTKGALQATGAMRWARRGLRAWAESRARRGP